MAEQIEHKGLVISIENNHVQVKIEQMSACASCHAKMMCSASESKEKVIMAEMAEPLTLGDEAVVYGEHRLGWLAVFLAFVLPVVVVMTGVVLFTRWLGAEAWGTLGIALLVPYYAVLHYCEPYFKREFVFYAKKSV